MTPQTLSQRPTLKILLYTDDPDAITDRKNLLGLSSMIERLEAHAPMFADLSIKWVSRNSDHNYRAENKLDLVMTREIEQTGEPFDEIWFFGLHQGNADKFSPGVFPCGPESELNADEIAALDKWMKAKEGVGGGVLMTGDHNNPILQKHLKNTNGQVGTGEESELLGLGRAIGHGVPRAGQLRKWEGAPSSRDSDSLDTLTRDGFQTDRIPQTLIHELVNEQGEPDPNGEPHPLFFYRSEGFIDIFPDHRHEGALIIPDLSNTTLWPVGPNGQPKPCIVGFGTHSKSGQRIGLVSAYDGDGANVGRIVADSSWHHYVNINLKGFPHPALPMSFSDKLGQFYSNLAIWLAPIHKRRQMAQAMCWELAGYTLLLEPQNDPLRIGEVAYSVLARSTSRCEIHELLRAFHQQQATLRGSVESMRDGAIHTPQEILGSVLKSIQKEMIRAEGTVRIGSFVLESIVTKGLTKARVAAMSSPGDSRINVTNQSKPGGQTSTMTSPVESKEWTIEMNGDSRSGKTPFSATLVFRLNTQDGIVTGEVWEGVDSRFLSKVSGTHQPLPSDAHWFISLDFQWGDVNITLSGVTLETPETVLFNGRYRVTASGVIASRPVEPVPSGGVVPVTIGGAGKFDRNGGPGMPLPPGDGDTGSGTGQQT